MSTNDISEVVDAKDELAFSRSVYPKLCANWYLNFLKTDIKTSMKFQVSTGKECNEVKSRYTNGENLDKLGLSRKVAVSLQVKSKQLKQNINQVSEAMDVLNRMKATRR